MRWWIAAASSLIAAIAFTTWASRHCAASVHAAGSVGSVHVDTTVDSDVARYVLEEYLAGHRRRAPLPAQHFSPDAAALLVASQLMHDNEAIQEVYERHLSEPADGRLRARAKGIEVLFVPGWLYRRHPETGASLEREIRALRNAGVDARRIATDENGSIEENARVIAAAIHAARAGRLILVSASKGGAEVMLALDSLVMPEDRRRVAAWVNAGGILGGTPLADEALTIPRRWLTGILLFRHCQGVVSMTRANASRWRRRVPSGVPVINLVAIPLSGDVTPRARDGYCALRRYGPNDGLALITDEIVPGTATITALGSDHYFEHVPAERRAIALLETVLEIEMTAHSPSARRFLLPRSEVVRGGCGAADKGVLVRGDELTEAEEKVGAGR